MIELRTHDQIPAGSLRTDWEFLVDEDPHATLFHTPRYLEVWQRVLGERVTPQIRTVHDDGRLIGVVPEGHEREGSPTGPVETRRFLGGSEVTDYLGPIARPEDRGDVVSAYLEILSEDVDWDELVAAGLAADTGWPEIFERNVERLGLSLVERADEDVCPVVDLSGGYEEYLGRLPGKQRHELRRKARKLSREVGDFRVVEVVEAELADRLEDFFTMAGETETAKAGFFRKEPMRDFFRALAEEFAADGTFRLHVLDISGTPAAATVSLVHRGLWGLYNSAFVPSLRMLAPGMVLVGELIEQAAGEDCHTFDLLRGDEPYKYRFGAEDRTLQRLTISRR